MPTFLLIGRDEEGRVRLLQQLAAIAELDPVETGDLLFFEGHWLGTPLRVETLVAGDLARVAAQADAADYLVPVIPEGDGPMRVDREQLQISPPRVEVPAVFCIKLADDPELSALIHLEVTELIRENRPRWVPRFVHGDCRSFMFVLARSFFTDCLTEF